jgi:epoxide hydrolase-like predicted phosphatase
MNYRAVIFDFGGVLVRMVDEHPRLELARQLGIELQQLDSLIFFSESARKASLGEISVETHWEAVRKSLAISPEAMSGSLDLYWSADDVNWELLEVIRKLRPKYKVGMLSNAWDNLRNTLHSRWNIDGLFDELVISAEVKMMKPDPRIFHMAVDRLGVQPIETIFIDDIEENVLAARKEGLSIILHQDTQKTISDLHKYLTGD